jgi:hypothetical protein
LRWRHLPNGFTSLPTRKVNATRSQPVDGSTPASFPSEGQSLVRS